MSASLPSEPEPRHWLARYGDELYRFALGRVGGEAEQAEELVQDTFLSALDALPSFRGQASERTWLFVILKRKIIDFYRRRARHPEVSLAAVTPDGPTEADFFRPDDGHWRAAQYPESWLTADGPVQQQELAQALRECQRRLPAQHAAVFALRFIEELSAEEICQELGLSASNYWVIVHRAKLQLRRCLEKQGVGAGRNA